MRDKKDCRKGSSDLKVPMPMPMPASLIRVAEYPY